MNNPKRRKIEKEYERPNHFNTICDVTIEIGNKRIQANRSLLAMTVKNFKDKFSDSEKNVIRISNVSEEGMEALVTFSYTGKITFTSENAVSLLKDADFLEVTDVKEQCEIFIRQNLEDVSLTKGYASLDLELLKSILSARELYSSIFPELMFEAIIRWVLNDLDNKKTYLPMLLRPVDTSKLSLDSFIKSLSKNEFKDSLGSKHDEFVTEVMSIFYDLKSGKSSGKSYIYVEDGDRCPNRAYIYDFTTETWTTLEGPTLGLRNGKFFAHNGKLYRYIDKKLDVFNFNEIQWVISDYNITTEEFNFDDTHTPWSINKFSFGTVLHDYLYVMTIENRELWRFSFETSTWSRVCLTKPVFISKPTELVALQGCIYAISISSQAGKYNHYVEIRKYKPGSSEWTLVIQTDFGAYCGGAVALNDKIYLIRPGIVYDLKIGEWTSEMARMNTPRYNPLVLEYKGKIWAIGGHNEQSRNLSSVEVYDPVSNSWSYGKPMETIEGDDVGGGIFSPSS